MRWFAGYEFVHIKSTVGSVLPEAAVWKYTLQDFHTQHPPRGRHNIFIENKLSSAAAWNI